MKLPSALIILFFFTALRPDIYGQTITFEYRWEKYFGTVPEKIVGIWPHHNRWTLERIKELKYKYGFNYFFVYPEQNFFTLTKSAGIDASNLLLQILATNYNWLSDINTAPPWGYYYDEPAERDISADAMQNVTDWYNKNFPDMKKVIGGYKRTDKLKSYVANYSDIVMFSSYQHYWTIFGYWVSCCPENFDQRSDWSDMKNIFGDKFSMVWIGAHKDLSDYPNLLGHAKNLGLRGVWLYQLQELSDDSANILKFCEAAAAEGFLLSSFQQVRNEMHDGTLYRQQMVGPKYKDSIPATFDHSNAVFGDITITNNTNDNYYAPESITAGFPYNFVVPAGKQVSLEAGNCVILKPGFSALRGCNFSAAAGK